MKYYTHCKIVGCTSFNENIWVTSWLIRVRIIFFKLGLIANSSFFLSFKTDNWPLVKSSNRTTRLPYRSTLDFWLSISNFIFLSWFFSRNRTVKINSIS